MSNQERNQRYAGNNYYDRDGQRSFALSQYEPQSQPWYHDEAPNGSPVLAPQQRERVHGLRIKPEHEDFQPPYRPSFTQKQPYFDDANELGDDQGYNQASRRTSKQHAQRPYCQHQGHEAEANFWNEPDDRKNNGRQGINSALYPANAPLNRKASPNIRVNSMIDRPEQSASKRQLSQNAVVAVASRYSPVRSQHLPQMNEANEELGGDWDAIQKKIDDNYQRKLKAVSEEAMLKLQSFQAEHQVHLAKTKMRYQKEQLERSGMKNQGDTIFSQFYGFLKSSQDVYLIDVLEHLNFLNNNHQLLAFLKSSNQNIVIKQGRMGSDVEKNLLNIICAILNFDNDDSSNQAEYINDQLLLSFIGTIQYGRHDPDLILIDQIFAIKSIINRPLFNLSQRQVKILQSKFSNLAEYRSSGPRASISQNLYADYSDSLAYKPVTPLLPQPGYSNKLQEQNHLNPDILNQQKIDKYILQMSDPRTAEESFAADNKKPVGRKSYREDKRFSQQEIDELYKAFKFFDKDSSGCLSRSELRNMLKSLHGNVENQYVNHVMSQVDLNNDGFISFQEFLIAAQSQQPAGTSSSQQDQQTYGVRQSQINNNNKPASSPQQQARVKRIHNLPEEGRDRDDEGAGYRGGNVPNIMNEARQSFAREHDNFEANAATQQQPTRKSSIVDLRIQSLLDKPRSRTNQSPNQRQDEDIINFPTPKSPREQQFVNRQQPRKRFVGLSREQFNEIRAAFNQIDQNKDGVLTKRELKNMLRPLHREVGEDEIAQIIEKADVNKDGVISFLEFQNAALQGAFSDVELRKSPSAAQHEYGRASREDVRQREQRDQDYPRDLRERDNNVQIKVNANNNGRQEDEMQYMPKLRNSSSKVLKSTDNSPKELKQQKLEQDTQPQVEHKSRSRPTEKYLLNDPNEAQNNNVATHKSTPNLSASYLNDRYVAKHNTDDFVQKNIDKYATKAAAQEPMEKEESEEEYTQPLVQLYDLTLQDLDHLKAQFKAVDQDNNGVLTERELKLFLKRLKVKLTDAQVSKMMKSADKSGDGLINLDEFIQASKAGQKDGELFNLGKKLPKKQKTVAVDDLEEVGDDGLSNQQLEQLRSLFKEVDTDGDGVLTKKELKFFIKNLKGPKISVKAFNQIVAAADEDGDGLIDFNEFIESQFVKSKKQKENEQVQKANQRQFDSQRKNQNQQREPNAMNHDLFKDLQGNREPALDRYTKPNDQMNDSFSFQEGPGDGKLGEPLCIMEIELDGGKTKEYIKIYRGQKAHEVVEDCRQKYDLSERAQMRLFEQITSQLEEK